MIRDLLPLRHGAAHADALGAQSLAKLHLSTAPLESSLLAPSATCRLAALTAFFVYTDAPSLHTQGVLPSGAAAPERVSARGRENPGGTYPNPRHRSALRPPVPLPPRLLAPSLPRPSPKTSPNLLHVACRRGMGIGGTGHPARRASRAMGLGIRWGTIGILLLWPKVCPGCGDDDPGVNTTN